MTTICFSIVASLYLVYIEKCVHTACKGSSRIGGIEDKCFSMLTKITSIQYRLRTNVNRTSNSCKIIQRWQPNI